MESLRPQSDSPEPTSEAKAASGEIVTIRRRLAELELACVLLHLDAEKLPYKVGKALGQSRVRNAMRSGWVMGLTPSWQSRDGG